MNVVCASHTRDDVYLDLSDWLEPRRIWHFDPGPGRVADTGLTPYPAIRLSPYESFRTFATVADGANWRDLIACCEQLIADGVTRPAKLAILGASAGGIAVGRAMTERPDLFAAVISDVGWSNPLRYVAEQNSSDEEGEWGTVHDEAGFRDLLAMDSYQAVRDGVRYPAVLCITGLTDPRVAPFHVAKFAARLRKASASGDPVLLRVDFDAGHGFGSTRLQSDALAADMYAFVIWRTNSQRMAETL